MYKVLFLSKPKANTDIEHINFVLLNVTPSLYCAAQSQPPLCRSIPLAPYALSNYTVGFVYSVVEINGADFILTANIFESGPRPTP